MEDAGKTIAGMVLCLGAGLLAGGAWWSLSAPRPSAAGGPTGFCTIATRCIPLTSRISRGSRRTAHATGAGVLRLRKGRRQGRPTGPRRRQARFGSARTSSSCRVRVEEVRKSGREEKRPDPRRVAADEARLFQVNAGADGLIREVSGATTGSRVKKEEVLASYYTNDSVTFRNQQNYLNALNVAGDAAFSDFARDTLKLAGLSDAQVQEMARTRKLTSTISLRRRSRVLFWRATSPPASASTRASSSTASPI